MANNKTLELSIKIAGKMDKSLMAALNGSQSQISSFARSISFGESVQRLFRGVIGECSDDLLCGGVQHIEGFRCGEQPGSVDAFQCLVRCGKEVGIGSEVRHCLFLCDGG